MQSKFNHPKHLDPQSQETLDFIKENQAANPKDAALKASNNPKINVLFAVNQISGKQIAKTKLPNWYMNKQVIYPSH
ncbi:SAM-dependent methyltransferase, partial [Gardnerella vaginalis]